MTYSKITYTKYEAISKNLCLEEKKRSSLFKNYLATASFSDFPALNLGALCAGLV